MTFRILLAMLVATLPGCGGGSSSHSTISVRGTVLLDGQPLDMGTILFEPKDGKGTGVSASIVTGSYETRVEPGLKIVRVSYPKVVRTEPAYPGSPDSPIIDITEEQIPAKYNSQSRLEKDLTEVTEPVNFDLVTK